MFMKTIIQLSILIFVALAVFLVTRAALTALVPLWRAAFAHLINYPLWLPNVPVNPFTLWVTKASVIERLATFAHERRRFRYELVLRYKEFSFWAAVIVIVVLYTTAPTDQLIVVGLLSLALAWYWPELYLKRQAVLVRRDSEKGLVHILDLLRLYVSAGHNLEMALRQVAAGTSGFWKLHLDIMVYRLDAGLSFEETFDQSARELGLPDFSRFLIALKQSRVLGASLGGTLLVQATLLRTRRRQTAEARARTAAVKIALPLVLCIFPALLIIYLTPAVLKVLQGV